MELMRKLHTCGDESLEMNVSLFTSKGQVIEFFSITSFEDDEVCIM